MLFTSTPFTRIDKAFFAAVPQVCWAKAAQIAGVCFNSMYKAIYEKELIPDKILKYNSASRGPTRIRVYYFFPSTLLAWKNRRTEMLTTRQACDYLGIAYKTLTRMIKKGKIIPDKTKQVSKGSRGTYLTFFFRKDTLDKFKRG